MLQYIVYRFDPVPSGKQVSDSFHLHQTTLLRLAFLKFCREAGGKPHATRGIFEA
jgi:hypothetical protein